MEQGEYMSKCFKKDIYITPIPHYYKYQIRINSNGVIKISDGLYPLVGDKSSIGLYDKMVDLYRQIAANIDKNLTN